MDRLAPERTDAKQAGADAPSAAATRPAFSRRLDGDPILMSHLRPILAPGDDRRVRASASFWESADADELARLANRFPPTFEGFDAAGAPVGRIDHHPAFHALMGRSAAAGLASAAWEEDEGEADERRQHRLRAVQLYLTAQREASHTLALTTTHAAVAVLGDAPDVEALWYPRIASRRYDRRDLAPADKEGLTVALALSERDSGHDLARTATLAEPAGGDRYLVYGEKTAVPHPTADGFLTLAQAPEGPTCVLVPRVGDPEGPAAPVRVRRLVETIGLGGMAVGDIVFDGAQAFRIGAAGRGIGVIADAVTLSQLDSALVSAALMRTALTAAIGALGHAADGTAGRPAPLSARIVADMALDQAIATSLVMRLATAYDRAFDDDGEYAFARLMTPVVKAWVTRLAPPFAMEAMDLAGPHAFAAAHPLAAAWRDAAANVARAGGTNLAALDFVRTIDRDPRTLDRVLDIIQLDLGKSAGRYIDWLRSVADEVRPDESLARRLIERLALCAAAGVLRQEAPAALADAVVASRLESPSNPDYGRLDPRFDPAAIIDAVAPAPAPSPYSPSPSAAAEPSAS